MEVKEDSQISKKNFWFISLIEQELTFVSGGRPKRLKRFLFLSFFLVLMMSCSFILAFSLALTRSSLARAWRSPTCVLNSETGSLVRVSRLSSVPRACSLTPPSGTMIWDTRLEMFDLTMSSLASAPRSPGASPSPSEASSSLANSLTKQI